MEPQGLGLQGASGRLS